MKEGLSIRLPISRRSYEIIYLLQSYAHCVWPRLCERIFTRRVGKLWKTSVVNLWRRQHQKEWYLPNCVGRTATSR